MPRGETDSGEPLTRLLAEQLFSRVSGTPPVGGNGVRLLRDGAGNYPAWLDAIAGARRTIHFENYIFRNDETGRRFAEALAARARAGVTVRLLYDWLGSLGRASPWFWRRLRRSGVQVRCFNPPRLSSPMGLASRNHRKILTVDGATGFVSGLCVGRMWLGDPARGIAPWRDTGVEIRGPAVAELDASFADTWALSGRPIPEDELPIEPDASPAGTVCLRIIRTEPATMGVYRLDQLIAAAARETLWLTDAYFVGTTAYVRTLCDAAADGVDVRLLVPGSSDVPVVKALSRAGYRPLLEAGIRVFEWNGPMLHAKTAVADGRWARIGSSNLNLASWIGNWEMDVAIEDSGIAAQMEAMFLEDLGNATEIVLDLGKVHATDGPRPDRRRRRGSPGRLAASAVGIGSAVGAAITRRRELGRAEAKAMVAVAALLLLFSFLAVWFPRLITVPLALFGLWIACTLLGRAWQLRASRRNLRGVRSWLLW